jgi:probable rRNA maturation factor
MCKTKHNVAVRIARQSICDEINTSQLGRLARYVCKRFNVARASVQISLVDDPAIKMLHKRFFKTAKTTDVISFDLTDADADINIFDIIINTDQARRQAAKRGHSVAAETALYLVHGLLHQLGFDDLSDSKAAKMHHQEDAILQEAGIGEVYYSSRKK